MSDERLERAIGIKTVLAFAAIYVLWGSTYLAIRTTVATTPPLFAAGVRFVVAGIVLYLWSWARSAPSPSILEWRNLIILASVMFLAPYAGLFWAERTLPSGVASILVATIPVWTLLLEVFVFRMTRFHVQSALAVLAGIGGVLLVAISQGKEAGALSIFACLAILGSELSWSFGTVLSKRLVLPVSHTVSAGAQMTSGGLMLLISSLLAGELIPFPRIEAKAVLATAYLIVAGSIVAFTSYLWLLARMSPTRVASYAYVNPVVALALGCWLGNETIHITTIIGAFFIVGSVSLIVASKSVRRELVGVETHVRN